MSATTALLQLRFTEIRRTWRIWVFPAVVLFFAITGPPSARFVHEILGVALGGDDAITLLVPDPTAIDANLQWSGNLTQIVILVVAVFAAGSINSEIRNGFAAVTLVKPASRATYVLTQALALFGFVIVVAFLGAIVSALLTLALFGEVAWAALFGATAVWVVLAAVVIAASFLASTLLDAAAGAAGIGIGAFFLLVLLGIVPVLARYTPAGLISLPGAVAAGASGLGPALWWPVVTGLALAVILLLAAVLNFQRREI